MNTKGLRISDIKNNKCIPLSELLINIPDPDQYKWLLLWFDVTPIKNEGAVLKNSIYREQRECLA